MNELYQSNLKNQRGNQKKQEVKFADQKNRKEEIHKIY